MYNFRSLSLRFSEVEIYAFHPRIYAIFRRKRKTKIFRFEEELEKFSFSQNCKLHLKFSGKQYWSLCNFEKVQVVLGWPNRYRPRTNLIYVYLCRHGGLLKQWALLRSSSLSTIPYLNGPRQTTDLCASVDMIFAHCYSQVGLGELRWLSWIVNSKWNFSIPQIIHRLRRVKRKWIDFIVKCNKSDTSQMFSSSSVLSRL